MPNKKIRDLRKSKKFSPVNHLDVTESLGYQTNRKNNRNSWSKEEDERLLSHVNSALVSFGHSNGLDDIKTIQASMEITKKVQWEAIAIHFEAQNRKGKDLRKRWTGSLDPNLKKGKWTPEEDQLLLKAYDKHGSHWLVISLEIGGRTEDQCAKRYIEVLRPDSAKRLRNWTVEEDLKLISKVKQYGTKWRKISSEMDCRPSLTCRNRWRKIITMVVRGKAREEITNAVKENKSLKLSEKSIETEETLNNSIDLNNNKGNTTNTMILDSTNSIDNGHSMHISLKHSVLHPDLFSKVENIDCHKDNINLSSKQAVTGSDKLPSNLRIQTPQSSEPMATPGISEEFLNSHNSHIINTQNISRAHLSSTEWKFTLKDGKGLSISNGTINTSELVKELIDQAKKYSLKISIHQHIHNHYRSPSDPGSTPHIFSEPVLNQQLVGSVPITTRSKENFYNENIGYKSNFENYSTDFLAQSPNFKSLGLGASPSIQIQTPHMGSIYSQHQSNRSPVFQGRTESISSRGSQSTPASDLRELGPNRSNHFNYLPPTLKPQLDSSDSSKLASLDKILNPNQDSLNSRNNGNFHKRKILNSSNNTPINLNNLNSETTNNNNQNIQYTNTPKTDSFLNEEEGLDFWESLRTLAGN